MKERQDTVRQQGFSMVIVLCIGALLVTLAAVLVRESGTLNTVTRRNLAREQAFQLAVSFSRRLEETLCADTHPEDSLGEFLDRHFLTEEYDETPLTLSCGEETDADYGRITLTLQKQALPLTKSIPAPAPGEEQALARTLAEGEQARAADYRVDVTVTVALDEATVSYTERYHRWVTGTMIYEYQGQRYRYLGDMRFQPEQEELPPLELSAMTEGMVGRFEPEADGVTCYTPLAEEWKNEDTTG